ncbi:ATP-binding protein, partial [Mariniblastus sp.]|nr:ATP-binding protein [Mariniblastus sp.]
IAQDEESCRFDGMPRAAAETGVVDLVLRPEQIGKIIAEHGGTPVDSAQVANANGLNGIFEMLRSEYGIDFSWYKSSTVDRRVERRVQILQLNNLDEYVDQIRNDRVELNNLYKDLLIGVTKFFRDPKAFERIAKEVIPNIFKNLPDDQEARFWVAGCATGEEAYSLAIMIDEHMTRMKKRHEVKIFATDAHRVSLDFASAGLYPEDSLAEVSKARIERYFKKHGGSYKVSPELRKMIVFSSHNLLRDAPITRMNLVTCRNLLIYFQPVAQKKVLSLFHFALASNGTLFLGPSEGLLDLADEFDPIDRSWKIYRKRRDVRLMNDFRISPPADFGLRVNSRPPVRRNSSSIGKDFVSKAYESLATEFMPPSFLVDEHYELLYTFPGAINFLMQKGGAPSTAILDMVDDDLRVVLAGALQRCSRQDEAVKFSKLSLHKANDKIVADLSVKPLAVDSKTRLFIVSIIPNDNPADTLSNALELDVDESVQERMGLLESELRHTRENLQAAIEELETSNEELQSTNEELVASNEELQSTNEELHSVNEELYTVNGEYQRKIEELVEVNDDFDNLFRSTEVASIFLDRELCIRKFTPQATETFQITLHDLGRRIDGFNHKINDDQLYNDVRDVASGKVRKVERDVCDSNGVWYLLRILPYESIESAGGVVLTLVDIRTLKQTQDELTIAKDAIQAAINGVLLTDLDWEVQTANPSFLEMFEFQGYDDIKGQRIVDLFSSKCVDRLKEICKEFSADEKPAKHEYMLRRKGGTTFQVEVAGTIFNDEFGEPRGRQLSFVDITRRRSAEESRESYAAQLEMANQTLRAAEVESRTAVEKRDQFLAILSHELRNPLGGIQNAVRVLNHPEADDAKVERAKKAIANQSLHMGRLMNDLLDVSRVTQGKINFDVQVIDVREVAEDAQDAVQSSLLAKKQVFEVVNSEKPLFIEADRDRLLQILNNLLTNASRYTPTGGHISLTLERDGIECVITVVDDGQGIDPDLKNTIFEMFVQSDATLDRADGGMGVGLTLVRSLVEKMGGTISVDSDGVGKGSKFVVRLPLSFKNARSEQELHSATLKDENASEKTILIVEDNVESLEMLKYLLELDGYKVLTATDGKTGLDTIVSKQPDIALVDIGLPELDGFQVAMKTREQLGNQLNTKLIALTGYGQNDDHKKIMDSGFVEHLVKPVDGKQLNRALKT